MARLVFDAVNSGAQQITRSPGPIAEQPRLKPGFALLGAILRTSDASMAAKWSQVALASVVGVVGVGTDPWMKFRTIS
jgi:hypothetical protein